MVHFLRTGNTINPFILYNVLRYIYLFAKSCNLCYWIYDYNVNMQEAFSHLLGEQNELTQELASQGMSIVYDIGDESMKKNLVNALVSTLTGSGKRKRAVKVSW